MSVINEMAIKLYRRLFSSSAGAALSEEGVETALDGSTAVAVTEAAIADSAALGPSFPSDGAGLAWRSEQQQRRSNLFGGLISAQETEGPRGALASAMGQAMAGNRATVFASGQDLATAQDLLRSAAGRHLPLVMHLDNRAISGQGAALGTGHGTLFLGADSGVFTLVASSVQEAVDFTLIARQVSEQSLIPGLVAMDGEQTSQALQNVRLASPELARRFIGAPGDDIPVPTESQRMLFGDTRRRVPNWHNLDNPVMHGALQGSECYALSSIAQGPYFEQHLASIMEQAFARFGELTGREYGPVSAHRLEDAELVLVVQGAAIETARLVADHLREQTKQRVGVLGIHCLRPFPGAEVARLLNGKKRAAVLERTDSPLAGCAPLIRELRATLDRARENSRFGGNTHPGYPAVADSATPHLRSVIYGLGGQPVRAADLIALCGELDKHSAPRLYLGLDFSHRSSPFPKRQVLLDNLRRAYPEMAEQGVRATEPAPKLAPEGSLTVAVQRVTGQGGEGLAVEAAALLQRVGGGQLRSRQGLAWESWGAECIDCFTHAPEGLLDPGDDLPVDLAVIATAQINPLLKPAAGLRDGGILLVIGEGDDPELWQGLTAEMRAAIRERNLALYAVAPRGRSPQPPQVHGRELSRERLLGALFAVLETEGLTEIKQRRLLQGREEALENLPESHRNEMLEALRKGVEEARRIDLEALVGAVEDAPPARSTRLPAAVRQLAGDGEVHDSLPRFWDQTGILYCRGEAHDLTADPYMAAATVPPLTSTFRDLSGMRDMLPAFEPESCTGCGNCWSACPDSAISAVAVTPGGLIDAGIKMTGADTLRQSGSKLAGRISSQGRSGKAGSGTIGTLLEASYDWLAEKMPLPEERKKAMDEAFQTVKAGIGALPVVFSEPFFKNLEAERKESGTLLSLAINPDTCKACGICVASCEAGALKSEKQDAGRLEQAREIWRIWEATPDTASEVIEKVAANPEVGPMAAVQLSRFCAQTVAGGDGAEAGSGEKIAVRMALAATEYQQQPRVHTFVQELGELLGNVKARIKTTLADALPVEDLDAVAAGLGQARGQVEVGELISKADAAAEGGSVDAVQLRRLVDVAKELDDLHWRLTEGEHGLGRARFGLAVAPGPVATWAGVYPNNPFQVPVAVDTTGDTAQMAAGLIGGQLRETVRAQLLIRRARLELDQPKGVEQTREELATLGWEDLTEKERSLCPPLLLLGNDETLGGRGFSQVARLLRSGLPVKILVLADLDLGLGSRGLEDAPLASSRDPKTDLGLMALAQRGAYAAQCSIAASGHLRQSVREALKFNGPALISVHVPSPQRHGFAPKRTLKQAEQALNSRAFPLFRYNPEKEGIFGSRITLEGNPDPKAVWLSDEAGSPLTPAQWALSERRFRSRFAPLSGDDPAPTALDAWLELDESGRRGKTPFIAVSEEGEELRYRIDPRLAAEIGRRGLAWRTLQELAGVATPFTAAAEQAVEARLGELHQAALATQKQEYEQQLKAQGNGAQAESAARVRDQLLKIAGYQ